VVSQLVTSLAFPGLPQIVMSATTRRGPPRRTRRSPAL